MWKIVKILLIVIFAVSICACTRKNVTADQEESIENTESETKTVIDLNDRTKTKSYPDNQEGLVMYVNDILGFDISDYCSEISGSITQTPNSLIARIIIKENEDEVFLEKFANSFRVRSAEEVWVSDMGKYYPPGMDSDVQIELQNNEVIGYTIRGYSGIHGETCLYHIYVIRENGRLVLLII